MATSDANVFWLGGSPCSGKSSISQILSSRFKISVYHVDEAFETHTQRLDPVRQPALTKWCESSCDERWMQPIDDLVQDVIACYQEHFALLREDILEMSKWKPLLVEGSALLPALVAGMLTNRRRAIWAIPSADFQKAHYSERKWTRELLAECSDPEVAFHNWMERDIRFAEWIEAETIVLDLPVLKVDGTRTLQENAEAIATHFQLVAHQS